MINTIKNQKGALTIDFIFALVLVLSMTMLLGVFSYSLSVVESIQYLTFSSSRAYFAADSSLEKQKQAGQKKFDDLSKTGAYKNFIKKDWFEVSMENIGDFKEIYGAEDARDVFEGVRTKIVVGLLNLNLPIFGSTEKDDSYTAYINSFLGREPSSDECMDMVSKRMSAIMDLSGGNYSAASGAKDKYVAFDDNGC